MWRTSPAKPVHASGVRRRGGSDSGFSSPLFSSPTSLSSRPPRLAPLSTAPALPTSSTPSSSIGNMGTTAAAGEAMAHAPAPSRTRPPGAFLGSSHDVPSSTALWPHAQARHPHPPHLAALSAHRPWPEEMSWRRSKPLTRRVTTTLTATSSTPEGKRRASRRSSEGRGDALDSPAPPLLPPPLPPHSPRTRAHEPAKGKEEEEEANAVREGGGATQLVRSSAGMPNQVGGPAIPSKELHTADVSSHDTLPAVAHFPSPRRAENEDSSVAAFVALQTELYTPLVSSTEASYTGCSEAKITCATAGAAAAAASEVAAPRSSVQWLVSEADAPPSDYALAHQLPQLFAEMIGDLAAAQPQPSAIADSSGSDAVERWIQQWFRARYHRTQSPSASPSSPAVKRARRNGARDPLTASRRDHAMVSFPRSGDRRRRGRRRSSASSTSSSAATGAASTSSSSISLSTCLLNQKFIPLAGAEAAATPVAEEASSSLCASLTSTTASHHDDGGGAHLLLRPTHCFMSTSQRTSATSMAVGAPVPLTSPQPPRAPPSQSPPPNANAVAGAARPPPPPPPPAQRSSTSAAVKRSTSGSIRGAAVVGGGRGPATSACAVVGLLSSMSAPEAAHSQK